MRRGAGLDRKTGELGRVGHSLDAWVGVWSEDEAREFLEAVKVFDRIDEETADRFARIAAGLRRKGQPIERTICGSPHTRWRAGRSWFHTMATSRLSTDWSGNGWAPNAQLRGKALHQGRRRARSARREEVVCRVPGHVCDTQKECVTGVTAWGLKSREHQQRVADVAIAEGWCSVANDT